LRYLLVRRVVPGAGTSRRHSDVARFPLPDRDCSSTLTNPVLAPRVFNEQTFTAAGLRIIRKTRSLQQIIARNAASPRDAFVRFTYGPERRPGRAADRSTTSREERIAGLRLTEAISPQGGAPSTFG
jgi:hypothetical protein